MPAMERIGETIASLRPDLRLHFRRRQVAEVRRGDGRDRLRLQPLPGLPSRRERM